MSEPQDLTIYFFDALMASETIFVEGTTEALEDLELVNCMGFAPEQPTHHEDADILSALDQVISSVLEHIPSEASTKYLGVKAEDEIRAETGPPEKSWLVEAAVQELSRLASFEDSSGQPLFPTIRLGVLVERMEDGQKQYTADLQDHEAEYTAWLFCKWELVDGVDRLSWAPFSKSNLYSRWERSRVIFREQLTGDDEPYNVWPHNMYLNVFGRILIPHPLRTQRMMMPIPSIDGTVDYPQLDAFVASMPEEDINTFDAELQHVTSKLDENRKGPLNTSPYIEHLWSGGYSSITGNVLYELAKHYSLKGIFDECLRRWPDCGVKKLNTIIKRMSAAYQARALQYGEDVWKYRQEIADIQEAKGILNKSQLKARHLR